MQSPLNKPNLMQIGIFPICKELKRNESAFAESRRAANDLKKKAELVAMSLSFSVFVTCTSILFTQFSEAPKHPLAN
jgi:hypothetical protein